MESSFKPVTLADRDAYYEVWQATPRRDLDYTLANLWGWQEYFGLEWRFAHDLCWIRQTAPTPLYWAPLGDWAKADWPRLLTDLGPQHFTRVPVELGDIWFAALPEKITLEEDRGQWEYLYLQSDLAKLAGPKLHKKKNHYNSYVKAYGEPDYQPVSDDSIKAVLELEESWCEWHECEDSPSLLAENRAITRVLTHWDCFRNMVGGYLLIKKQMVAFSIGEKLDSEMLGVHFEKALSGYKGLYQAINLEFAKIAGEGFKWINRAQDMGEEGLRQAKMTYVPEGFLRKYKVILAGA